MIVNNEYPTIKNISLFLLQFNFKRICLIEIIPNIINTTGTTNIGIEMDNPSKKGKLILYKLDKILINLILS